MDDNLKIIIQAQLDEDLSSTKIIKQLPEVAKLVNKQSILKLVAELDTKQVQNHVKKVVDSVNKKSQNVSVDIFNTNKLDKDGVKYFAQVNNIVNRVKKEFASMGDVNVTNVFKTAKGSIQSFTAEVTKANGVVEKFNFNKGKLKTDSGSKIGGFIQSNSLLTDKNAGSNIQATINQVQKLEIALSKVKYSSLDSPKALKDVNHINDIKAKYDEVKISLDSLKNTNGKLSNEQTRSYNKLKAELDSLIKKYKEIENADKSSNKDAALLK